MITYLKNTAKHTLIFSLSSILSKAIGFFLLPIYTRYLNPTDYGILEILSLLLNVSIFFITQGLPSALFRSYSYEYVDDEKMRKQAVSTSILYVSIVGFIFSASFYLSAGYINKVIYGTKNYTHLIQMIAITAFIVTSSHIPSALLRAKLKSIQLSISSIVYLLLNISLNLYFILILKIGLKGLIYGNLISAFLFSLILFMLVSKDISRTFSFKILKKMLIYGLPLVPAGLALFLMNGSDRFFLQYFSTSHEVGLYGVGYKISAIISFIIFEPFLLVWPSIYFQAATESNGPDFFSRFLTIFFLIVSFASLGAILLSKPVIMLITPQEFWGASAICTWLILGFALNGLSNVLNVGIYIKQKTQLITVITIISTITNLILNFILIPSYGIMGASISTFISFLIMSILSYLFNQRVYPIHYPWVKIVKNILIFIICLSGSCFITVEGLYRGLIKAIIILSIFSVSILLSGYFSRDEINRVTALVKRKLVSRNT
ncbi:MAG: hypothetical protein EHM45_07195 [Desulfobacteraceae bacterium]|nr:MAG: hypothetical protein EHM45_07195 [Desulfobacteraceae bacterium]